MRKVAAGVWQLRGWPPDVINVYLAGDVLIDTGTRLAKWRIAQQLPRRRIRLVALTHAHPDHMGSARAVCRRFGVSLACHEADVPVAEGRAPMLPQLQRPRWLDWILQPPAWPVERVLHDGDVVGEFRVVHTPGHTPGHVVYFREGDRVAIAGDLAVNIHFLTREEGLREPPPFFSVDPAANRRSLQVLMALQPRLVCFGHGPPLRDMARLEQFVSGLALSEG